MSNVAPIVQLIKNLPTRDIMQIYNFIGDLVKEKSVSTPEDPVRDFVRNYMDKSRRCIR